MSENVIASVDAIEKGEGAKINIKPLQSKPALLKPTVKEVAVETTNGSTRVLPYLNPSMILSSKRLGLGGDRKLKCCVSNIFIFRCLTVISLLGAAAIVGYFSFLLRRNDEIRLFESQYDSVSRQAADAARDNLERMSEALKLMASLMGEEYPNADDWPQASFTGINSFANHINKMSSLEGVAYVPLLRPDQVSEFETYAQSFYPNDPDTSATAGLTGCGYKVWFYNPESPCGDGTFPDNTGFTYLYDSPNFVVTPLFQISNSDTLSEKLYMLNLKQIVEYGKPADQTIACVNEKQLNDEDVTECSYISDLIGFPWDFEGHDFGKSTDSLSILFAPIFPRFNSTTLVGFAGGFVLWSDVLKNVVPKYVNEMDFVLKSGSEQYTYRIKNGDPEFKGEGDHHDKDFSKYKHSKNLISDNVANGGTSEYTFTFYPRQEYYEEFLTDAPMKTCITAVLIIVVTSLIFLLYDIAVKIESNRKQNVLDTKRRFVRFISHEIRTPLNTVKLGLSLLEAELNALMTRVSCAPREETIPLITQALIGWLELTNDIMSNSESAVTVLDDLLNYDKVEMGTLRLEFTAVFIWDVIKKVFKAFELGAKQKNVELHFDVERWNPSTVRQRKGELDLLRVVGDDVRIAQVLRNLISNALKFTPEGGHIHVSAVWLPNGLPNASFKLPEEKLDLIESPRAGSVKIAVKDSGAGLSEEQLKNMFQEGVQFNANLLQAGGGSGLGLFISKGIAESHGGKLSVDSEGLGKGTTFTLEMPLYKYPTGFMPRAMSMISAASTSGAVTGLAPRRIFIVDDAISNRKLLKRLLTNKGHDCVEAKDGQEAVEIFKETDDKGEFFDAIVMDYEMPRMNGPTATKHIRAMGCTCLIVGVTGNMLPEDVKFFLDHGANEVLGKPLNIERFEQIIKNFREDINLYNDGPRPSSTSSQPSGAGGLASFNNDLPNSDGVSNAATEEANSFSMKQNTPACARKGSALEILPLSGKYILPTISSTKVHPGADVINDEKDKFLHSKTGLYV